MTSQADPAQQLRRDEPYCVIARLTANDADAAALLDALRQVRPMVQGDSGTAAFAVHRATHDPLVIWVYERYSSEAAYQAHRQELIDTGLETRLRPYVAEREVFHLSLDWAE
jgi:quinol monooxygenase YgiN